MPRTAIIDLGTNTFNLLIVDIDKVNRTYETVFQTKIPVKLGEGGINQNFIQPNAFQRGINALITYKQTIASYNCNHTIAFATSAIRGASNGIDFINEAKQQSDISIQAISGEKEAELIYYGVKQAVELNDTYSLIMDIGGGSTEFIIANRNGAVWKQSFLLGVSRLLEKFKPSEPISESEIKLVQEYLAQELIPLTEALNKYNVTELVGSSGSFDSLAEMIAYKFYNISIIYNKTEYVFKMANFNDIYNQIIKSTKEERLQMKGLLEMRADMIVLSVILVQHILQSYSISQMRLSTYSLKEGMLYELINS